ncbi:MAG TPA: response regulator [Methylomirabilota bacterium]|nr:response regulator [Methylomirabilota bacterium]
MLEDNLQDRELIRLTLEEEKIDCEMTFASGRGDFETFFARGGFHFILSDYALPQFDGLAALRLVRAKNPDIPFILISGTLGEEQAVECLKLGATDYILKHRLARLGLAIRRAWREAQARAAQRQVEEVVRKLSGRLLTVQDDERRRIARVLHDNVAQNLLALALNLNFAQRLVPPGDKELAAIVSECVETADATATALRHISYLLHPPALDTIGLRGALIDFVSAFSRRTGIKVGLTVPPKFGRLAASIETALYRVAQESLENVEEHSGSVTATVKLRRSKDFITLEIHDAGRGIPPETLRLFGHGSIGVGIPGMRERLQMLQGELEIRSGAGGTRVRAIVPIT